jgi:hypothetical protein
MTDRSDSGRIAGTTLTRCRRSTSSTRIRTESIGVTAIAKNFCTFGDVPDDLAKLSISVSGQPYVGEGLE